MLLFLEMKNAFTESGKSASRDSIKSKVLGKGGEQRRLDRTVDALRERFGNQSVVFAHSVKKEDKEKEENKP